MVNRVFLSSLTVMVALTSFLSANSEFPAQKSTIDDRIKGAVLASAIGDALGRVTTDLETVKEIQTIYGEAGITSFKNFSDTDWAWLRGYKVAAYSVNTVTALMVLEALTQARTTQLSPDAINDLIGRSLIELYGPNNKEIDPLFDARKHTAQDLEGAARLTELLKNQTTVNWWSTEDIHEPDSGILARAWPLGIAYSDSLEAIYEYVDSLTQLTDRHPTSRAASAALAAGIASSLNGASPDDVTTHMIRAAEKYDRIEKEHKKGSKKKKTSEKISNNAVLTSDMIRYAVDAAKNNVQPEDILGSTSKKQSNGRSFRGSLLGYVPDEAVAAAAYIFTRHSDDPKGAIIEGANAAGRSCLIASLAGALVGARTGLSALKAQDFEFELEMIENRKQLEHGAFALAKLFDPTLVEEDDSCFLSGLFDFALFAGIGIGGAYLIHKYVNRKQV